LTNKKPSGNEDTAVYDRPELEQTLRSVAKKCIANLGHIDREKAPSHIKKYISWIERQIHQETNGEDPEVGDLTSKLEDLVTKQPSWKMFTDIAKNFVSIVRGEAHDVDLSISSTSFQDYLDEAVAAVLNDDVESRLELLAHQKPTQRILELGARRGAFTNYVLSVCQGIEARTGGIAFSEYTYSESSAELLEEAKKRFAEHLHRLDFTSLDVNKDLTAQGLHPASYDVIFASDIIRGAKDVSVVLQNLRKVLTPGGQLFLHEITAPGRFEIGFGFGAAADWWSGHEDEQDWDWTTTTSQLDAALKENGFSGADLFIKNSLVVSREATQPSLPLTGSTVFVVVDDDEFQNALANNIVQAASWNSRVLALKEMADQKLESGDYIVCLADVYKPFLHPMKQETLNLVREWVRQSTNLFWVTAYGAETTDLPSSYVYAGIKDGFLRTLRSEYALNRIISLTVGDNSRDASTCAKYVSSVFASAFGGLASDDEYIVKNGQVLTGRLVDDINTNKDLTLSIEPEGITEPWLPGPPMRLAIQTRGQLETLQFKEDLAYFDELRPTDVEIEAKVWGVGFRDVFVALGRLDEDDFGADCAGIVTRVGAEVTSFKAGDRVCMQTVDGMRTYPRSHEWTTAKIADNVSFEDACAIIIPGMTSLQGLIEVARLEQGEKVLIHSASGGTGQLAVQVAQWAGAEVFATVGYDHKKQLLMDEYGIPADHIFYSRDTSFAQGIKRITNGYGVDVVLNSLAGEPLRASWECIAPYGRMIEIGKADINANSSLPMGGFRKNCLYAGVDLHHIVKDINKKRLAKRLLQKAMDLASEGSVRAPSPLHVYDVDKVEDAFRYLASGKNTGRIVIRVDSSTVVEVRDET
jgi:NADPH:quinone reductase-like Zn-dependent oxidoreductase/SAM-dependent methyltransferase